MLKILDETECGTRSFQRFCKTLLWKFCRPVGQLFSWPGKKEIAAGTYQTNKQNLTNNLMPQGVLEIYFFFRIKAICILGTQIRRCQSRKGIHH